MLLGLEFTLGERRLKGVVAKREQAETDYEEAIDAGHSAVLLERTADGLYAVSVGNLMAGEEATVEVRYGQLLSFVQGQVRIAIPTVIAPRYGDAGAAGRAACDTGNRPRRRRLPEPPGHEAMGRRALRRRLEGRVDGDFIVTIDALAGRTLATAAPDRDGWVALVVLLANVERPGEGNVAHAQGARRLLEVDERRQHRAGRQAVARLLNRSSAPGRVSLSASD